MNKRRAAILELLKKRDLPVTGNELAQQFDVSRQVIVQDIALLRAEGMDIVATPRGYCFDESERLPALTRRLACRHTPDQTGLELSLMIEAGCRVLDVIVEHPLYGEIRGMLHLSNQDDVEDFLQRYESQQAQLLSSLTGGVHLHTLEASHHRAFALVEKLLRQHNMLL